MSRNSDFAATLANYVGQASFAASLDSTGNVPASQLGNVPVSGKVSGDLVQQVMVQVQGVTTTSGFIADDNSAFLLSNGSGFGLVVNMKPTSTLNKVYARGDFYGATNEVSGIAGGCHWGFFVGSSTVATITGTWLGQSTAAAANNQMSYAGFQWQVSTVSVATTNYTVRLAATNSTDIFTLNGEGGAARHNNSVMSSLTVWEVQN